MSKKIYTCCICHKELEDMPVRLVKQVGDNREYYRSFKNRANYDFCTRCYKVFNNWIIKNREDRANEKN